MVISLVIGMVVGLAIFVPIAVSQARKKPVAKARPRPASHARKPSSTWSQETRLPRPTKTEPLIAEGRLGVVGENYHTSKIADVVAGRYVAPTGDWDHGLIETAYLVREPDNPYDSDAVAVRMPVGDKTVLVGYLPGEDAPRWQRRLGALEHDGVTIECEAAIYRSGDGYAIVLHVGGPDLPQTINALPDGARPVAAEHQCAVTGEQHHLGAIEPYVGQDGMVWATLHPAVVPSGKHKGETTIEVHIDGEPVGTLTALMGSRYADLVAGDTVHACRAIVQPGAKHPEVSIMLPERR
jgi:hypothetical protein